MSLPEEQVQNLYATLEISSGWHIKYKKKIVYDIARSEYIIGMLAALYVSFQKLCGRMICKDNRVLISSCFLFLFLYIKF
jgi:hypothetical protein